MLARLVPFCMLPFLVGSASAAFISISDLTEGPPVVLTDIPGPTLSLAAEEVTINFSLPIGLQEIVPGVRSVILLDPAGGPDVPGGPSDFVTIIVSLAALGSQFIELDFQSGDSPGFDVNVAALQLLGAPEITETGSLQDVSALLNTSPALTVLVASDVEAASVPEPASGVFMVAGLLVIAVFAYRRRLRQHPPAAVLPY